MKKSALEAYEKGCLVAYENDCREILRKVLAEYERLLREKAAAEKALPHIIFTGQYYA